MNNRDLMTSKNPPDDLPKKSQQTTKKTLKPFHPSSRFMLKEGVREMRLS